MNSCTRLIFVPKIPTTLPDDGIGRQDSYRSKVTWSRFHCRDPRGPSFLKGEGVRSLSSSFLSVRVDYYVTVREFSLFTIETKDESRWAPCKPDTSVSMPENQRETLRRCEYGCFVGIRGNEDTKPLCLWSGEESEHFEMRETRKGSLS